MVDEEAEEEEASTDSRARVRCNAFVLDWDKLEDSEVDGRTFDLIIGAEIIHEIPHAQGVFNALRRLLAKRGQAVVVNAAPYHRYGGQEFEDLLRGAQDMVVEISPVAEELTADLEALREKMLELRLYRIRWKEDGDNSR
mmetsp:Transcript_5346/g.18880  ORF Transcript_5346/g.18880 Transcript_5346/m.18880 type:complete len:140 (+) Transcript_5346:3-422(+)